MRKCRDVMKVDLRWIPADATALDAARLMRESSVGFLPICDPRTGRLAAVITDRDLATRLCAADRRPSQTPVLDVATPDPLCCRGATSLRVAEAAMIRNQVSRIVVVDADGHPVGVISLTDILVHERARRALWAARGVLARESDGPHPPTDDIALTPAAPGEPITPPWVPSADEIYRTSAPAREREDVVVGGRVTREMKEFPR